MSTQQLEQFNQGVSQDQALQVELAQATSRGGFVNLAVQLGEERGFSFTAEEMDQEINRREEMNQAERWVSDELLESVAGHQAHGSETGTCTCRGCSTFSTIGCHTGDKCDCAF